MKKVMTMCFMTMLVVAVSGVAQGGLIATNGSGVDVYATLAGGASFDTLQPNTAYQINITSNKDVIYFGTNNQVYNDPFNNFDLDSGGDVVFTSTAVYSQFDKSGGGTGDATISTDRYLSGDGYKLYNEHVTVPGSRSPDGVYTAGKTILTLNILTGGPGESTFTFSRDGDKNDVNVKSDLKYYDTTWHWAELKNGSFTPIAITVVPEPATLALLGLGGLLLRKRK